MSILFLIWAGVVAALSAAFIQYDRTPGEVGVVETHRPVLDDGHTPDRPVILLFAHPHCPCTRYALTATASLLERHPGTCELRVLFVRPEGAPPDWCVGQNWELATKGRAARVETDDGGRLATALGVRTSGHVLVYAADGRLLFSGGVSASRSVGGEEIRCESVLERVLLGGQPPVRADVFGCPLFDQPRGES